MIVIVILILFIEALKPCGCTGLYRFTVADNLESNIRAFFKNSKKI
jgi:hypothetical protein